ncbi:DUF3054 domain-containing protein [Pseudokineococcus sp. 1T1Z-3]|uniref:DUF3054 domain-containing protein n=1 Tax=Pseudokineococcus sp. 1T1Z-3 TaxID=3132745 RepID=UPI0030B631FD
MSRPHERRRSAQQRAQRRTQQQARRRRREEQAVVEPAPAGGAPARPPVAGLAVDLVAVLVFAGVGRASHGEGLGLLQVLGTALPFWAGVVLAWALPRVHRDPTRVVPAGVLVLAASVSLGMVLRLATGQGAEPSFVVVTTLVLAVLMLGWRALAGRAARRSG